MAVKTILVDDIDGVSPAKETLTFAFADAIYEIDLNDQHGREFRAMARQYAKAGRCVQNGHGRGEVLPALPKRIPGAGPMPGKTDWENGPVPGQQEPAAPTDADPYQLIAELTAWGAYEQSQTATLGRPARRSRRARREKS